MRGSREISLVPSLHRASTDALIRANRRAFSYPFRMCPFANRVDVGADHQRALLQE